jgi:iron complex outermembrane recepter protein
VNRSILERAPSTAECFAPGGPRTSFWRAFCVTVLLSIMRWPLKSPAQQQNVIDDKPADIVASFDSGPPDSSAAATNKGVTPDPPMSDKTITDKTGSDKSILDLDIDQLGKVQAKVPTAFDTEVTTVTANRSSLGKSAAAVFVITNEMIRRSGATSVPDCLRMVPGLQVTRVTSSQWAISSRGFNDQNSDDLLVLIDGRSVYSPFSGGVFWDTQDLVLQDIDRIEVIRGPGATIWGANAVNGVINIITKTASETQGVQAIGGGGNKDRTIDSLRYGGKIGENTFYRLYVKGFDRGPETNAAGGLDAWNQLRSGFRLDSQSPEKNETFTLQGDIYSGVDGQVGTIPQLTAPFFTQAEEENRVAGGNLLGRWTRVVDANNTYSVQAYYDRADRVDLDFRSDVNTYDAQFQWNLKHSENHVLTMGAGYRLVSDDIQGNEPLAALIPASALINEPSAFLQEEMPLFRDDLKLIVGSKFLYYNFTGFEYQPSVRVLWEIDANQVLWGAVSRAVRTPSRLEEDALITAVTRTPTTVFNTQIPPSSLSLLSEQLTAYELGYRKQFNDRLSIEVAAFANDYRKLLSLDPINVTPGLPPIVTLQYHNSQNAESYGVEFNWLWTIHEKWKLQGWYSFIEVFSHGGEPGEAGTTPLNQAFLMSSWDLPRHFELDVMARYVDSLPTDNIPAYSSLDVRLGWRPNADWDFSIVGQNLLAPHHLEFLNDPYILTAIDRGVFAQIVWRH